MFHKPIATKKGYEFFEVSSAVQKSIRRGDEETALYFAVELYNSGYDEYLWKRLKIITSEDVGLAEPSMASTIHALWENYLDQKKKDKAGDKEPHRYSCRIFLVHALLLLCRCRKSRLVDWTQIAIWRDHDLVDLPIPDYAYDKHNDKGRKLGRGVDHFYHEGTLLANYEEQDQEEERKGRAYEAETRPKPSVPPKGAAELFTKEIP